MPKFGAQIDTMGIPIKSLSADGGIAFPATPFEGQLFHRTDLKQYYVYLNAAWVRSDNGGTAASTHIHAIADVTGLTAELAAKAPTENPTFTGTVSGVTKTHVGLGNVDNTSDANKPVSTATSTALSGKADTVHTHTKAQITDLGNATDLVAGLVELATTTEATTGTDTARAVTPAGVKAALNALIAAAPGTLDTLDEIASALGDDPNFATTMTNALAGKAPTVHGHALTDANITGLLSVAKGGTSASNVYSARGNLIAAGSFGGTLSLALVAGVWSVNIAHGLNSVNVSASANLVSTGEVIIIDWRVIDANNIQFRSDVALAASSLRIHVTTGQ